MEKIDGELAPYAIVAHYGANEEKLFYNMLSSKEFKWQQIQGICIHSSSW